MKCLEKFNTLVNEYRIREACRRIADHENYGHLNLEGLSASVGFKSRTTFFNAFKSVTGLTPSEYLKRAKSERKG